MQIAKKNMYRALIVGSRNFDDYELLEEIMDGRLADKSSVEIVSGGARGADSLAERYAKERGYKLTVFPADWDKYGKSAGYIRNEEMHRYIRESSERLCVAFWDGESKGTAHNFELSKKYNNPIDIVNYNEKTLYDVEK